MISLKQQLPNLRIPIRFFLSPARTVVTEPRIAASDLKWDLVAGVCIERLPVITPINRPRESSMVGTLAEMELEQSMLNDHELRHQADLERQEKKKRGEILEGDDESAVITALDLEDGWKKEVGEFEVADRLTDADRNVDVKSVHRRLDIPLRLLARYKLGDDQYWDLPWVVRKDGESLRDTAERAVVERCGGGLDVRVLGNAPASFYKYKYPKHYQERVEKQGAKVWLFKAYLMNGYFSPSVVNMGKNVIDYQWATFKEMENLVDSDTFKAITNMLHEEED